MHQFGQQSSDGISSLEAQEVLRAWADRRQAQGVDPNVGSVSALAEALGVSEDEVRRMLEDVRVQKRSEQMAAGILQQESARRKKLDVTAAIGAAIAVLVVALVVGAAFFFTRSSQSTAPPAIVTGTEFIPPAPMEITIPEMPPIPQHIDEAALAKALAALEIAETRLEERLAKREAEAARKEEIQALQQEIEALQRRIAELKAQAEANETPAPSAR